MRKHKSVILKLLSAACALLLAIQVMSPAAYALNGVGEGSDAASGPLYDVYQIFQCDVRPAEEADLPYLDEGVQIGDKLASNFRFGKNVSFEKIWPGVDLTDPAFLEALAATGIVPEVGGTIPDTFVEQELIFAASSYDEQHFVWALQQWLDMDSEPYAAGLTLAELNAYTAEPGYYLIINTPGSVTGNSGYTRGITTVTDSETGFDVIPKSFSLELDKSVARLPMVGAGMSILDPDNGAEPFINGGVEDPEAPIPDDLLGLYDNLAALAPALDTVGDLLDNGYAPEFNKKVLLNATDAALYKLTVQVPESVCESFPEAFYMQIQDMLPDGFIGFPFGVEVRDGYSESTKISSIQLLHQSGIGRGKVTSAVAAWLSNAKNSTDFDLLRSEFKVNVVLNMMLIFGGPTQGSLGAREAENKAIVDVYIYAMPVLDGHDTDQMPIALDANVNNSRLFYQNNPNEVIGDVQTVSDADALVWRDASVYWENSRVQGFPDGIYVHRCSDVGIGEAVSGGPVEIDVPYKQLSLACTADSDRTQADAYLSGLTFYYGSRTGQPISNAKFSLRRLPIDLSSPGNGLADGLETFSNMTFAALRQPVFSASEIGLYRKLTSGAYTPLTDLPADRYADELLYQAHAAHMPSLGYIAPMLPQDGGTDLDETRMDELRQKNAVIITTDENGMVSFVGLPMGDYCLEPLAPVQGYNLAEPVCFSIEADVSGEGRQISFVRPEYTRDPGDFGSGISLFANGPENAPELVMSPDGWFYLNLIASSGVVLPTTGGAGTAAIIVTGAGLLGLAIAFVLIRRRRQMAQ